VPSGIGDERGPQNLQCYSAERIVLTEYVLSEEGHTYPKYVIPRSDIPQEEIAGQK
jgi:hypothetical protein